jgi:hypothetical protein
MVFMRRLMMGHFSEVRVIKKCLYDIRKSLFFQKHKETVEEFGVTSENFISREMICVANDIKFS